MYEWFLLIIGTIGLIIIIKLTKIKYGFRLVGG